MVIVGVFNLPAIIALLGFALQKSHKPRKCSKVLLKVGIAKAFGGLMLAVYMSIKFFWMLHSAESNTKATIKLYALYLGASALVDIIYSLVALMILKKSKQIVRVMRRKCSHAKRLSSSSSSTSEGSNSDCSDVENSDKCLHYRL